MSRMGSARTRWKAVAAAALVGLVAAACGPMPPPTDGSDLGVTVPARTAAPIGGTVTYPVTVVSSGTAPTTGPVALSVVVPPGQTVTAAAGDGWTCSVDGVQASCSIADADVAAGARLPRVDVTASVAGPTYLAELYATVRSEGDANPANDQSIGRVVVSPPVEGDQLYVQLAGALSLRSGGNISSGDVSITPAETGGLGGADRILIDATVGTTRVQADLQRGFFTLFSGPVTITDPRLPGGEPVTVNWRGPFLGFGPIPWRSLQSELLDVRIPSLDVGGITGALGGGISFTVNLSAGDYSPTPAPAGEPAMTFTDINTAEVNTRFATPTRVVAGADVTLPLEVLPRGGSTVGPVSATVDLPPGLEYRGTGSGTTCTPVTAVPGRLRCTLTSSLDESLRPNLLASIAGAVLPVSPPQINLRVRAGSAGVSYTVGADLTSANIVTQTASTTFTALPTGPEVGLAMNGPELTPTLFFTEGAGRSGNQYDLAVDNVGTATSASSPTVTLNLPPGVSYRGVNSSGLTAATRWTCSAAGPTVTCSRPNGIPVTSLLNPASTFSVLVDVAVPSGPLAATASVVNSNDVDPGGPSKSASASTLVAAADAPTFDLSLSNGAFSATDRPVLSGGYSFSTSPSGRLDAISGCGTSRNYVPPVLAVPIVGPTLVPAVFADNQLCVDVTRVPGTNDWTGTVRSDFVTAPVFLPPPVPQELPLPPIIGPRSVSVTADSDATVGGPVSGSVTGGADGNSVQLVLNGGANFTTNWRLTVPASVTCTDVGACP